MVQFLSKHRQFPVGTTLLYIGRLFGLHKEECPDFRKKKNFFYTTHVEKFCSRQNDIFYAEMSFHNF